MLNPGTWCGYEKMIPRLRTSYIMLIQHSLDVLLGSIRAYNSPLRDGIHYAVFVSIVNIVSVPKWRIN